MTRYSSTERIGVNAVERIVVNELGWIFREQPIVDMGIDAHIEHVENGRPTGQLIAVQIKTGSSHLHETDTHFTYYGDLAHLDYWTGHSLPVLLIMHLPVTGETFWIAVTEQAVIRTNRGWKIEVPKTNAFNNSQRTMVARYFMGTPAQTSARKLAIDEPLMRHIAAGGKVSVGLEDWVNKSLGRTQVQVFVHDEAGNEKLTQDWFQMYVGYGPKELAETLFPWALASVDEEFYEENAEEDDEVSSYDMDGVNQSGRNGIRPYLTAGGEVEYFRLKLDLNHLGTSYLMLSDNIKSTL